MVKESSQEVTKFSPGKKATQMDLGGLYENMVLPLSTDTQFLVRDIP